MMKIPKLGEKPKKVVFHTLLFFYVPLTVALPVALITGLMVVMIIGVIVVGTGVGVGVLKTA